MNNQRIYNAKRNMGSDFVYKMVGLLTSFAVRTVLIKYLGADYGGMDELFTSVLSVLNIAELGFSSAVAFSLYKPLAEVDTDRICSLLFFYRKIYRYIGMFVFIAGFSVLPFIRHFVKDAYPERINIYILFAFHVVNTGLGYLLFSYKEVLLSASQRKDVVSKIDTLIILSKSVVQVLVLVLSHNYYMYIVVMVVASVLRNLLIQFSTKKLYPLYSCGSDLNQDDKRIIFKQVQGLAIGRLDVASRNTFDSLLISINCGLVYVTIYGNYYTIFAGVTAILSVFTSSILAGVGNSIAIESKEKNFNDYKRIEYYYWIISSICTICLLNLYQPFMQLWMGEDFVLPEHTMILFVLYFYVSQLGRVRAVYANAAGIWWHVRKLAIFEMISNIVLNILLGYIWGIDGIVFATILTVFIFSILGVTSVLYRVYFERSGKEFIGHLFQKSVVVVLIAFLSRALSRVINEVSIKGLFFRASICVFVSLLLLGLYTFLTKSRREYIIMLYKDLKK